MEPETMTFSLARHLAFAAGFIGFATMAMPNPSTAASTTVQLACADDYYAYCSRHDPDSKGVRTCMRSHGAKLSQGCVSALVAAGEISKPQVSRRASARR